MICVQSSSHMPSSHFKWQFYPPPNSRCWIKVTKILESTLASCLSCDLFSFFLRVEQQRDKDNAQLLNLHFHAHQIADVNTRIKDLGACNPWFRVLSRLTVFRERPIFVFTNNVYNIKMSIQSLIRILKTWPKETFCPCIHPVFSIQKPHVLSSSAAILGSRRLGRELHAPRFAEHDDTFISWFLFRSPFRRLPHLQGNHPPHPLPHPSSLTLFSCIFTQLFGAPTVDAPSCCPGWGAAFPWGPPSCLPADGHTPKRRASR